MRQTEDQFVPPDFFGLSALETEPAGLATRESLKQRLSRQVSLERLVGVYGGFGPDNLRAKLKELLVAASERLGAPEATSDFGDPRFMARHELNLIDPQNWREARLEDGSAMTGLEYVPPDVEAKHLAALAAGGVSRFEAANVRAALLLVIDDPSRSSEEIAAQGVAWARAQSSVSKAHDDDEDENFLDNEGVRAAALVAVRDGSDDLRLEHGAWAEQTFIDALSAPDDAAHRMRSGLKFNPVATAFAGIAELHRRDPTPARLRLLLEIAARKSPAGAHGFRTVATSLADFDERIPMAIIRCAFTAAVKPVSKWSDAEEEVARRADLYVTQTAKAVEGELAWLNGTGTEPAWPRFEAEGIRPVRRRRRRGIRIGGPPSQQGAASGDRVAPPETYVDEHAASLWIGSLRSLLDVSKRPWLREFATAYADFSANLNGLGLEPGEELSQAPHEWNANYYPLLARTLIGLSEAEIDELALRRILDLPDEPYFDVMPEFLKAVDVIYFDEKALQTEAPHIRQRLIDRLKASSGWRRLVGSRSSAIEVHLGPAIASIFFNNYILRQTSTYLTPIAIERIGPFLPQLIDLLTDGPSYFTALVTMDLLEVSPQPSLLPVLIAGGKTWSGSYGDDTGLWVDHGIGRRVCTWIERIRQNWPKALATGQLGRQDIDTILAALVRLGVPEARQLEAALAAL